jgi:hypothetical protein
MWFISVEGTTMVEAIPPTGGIDSRLHVERSRCNGKLSYTEKDVEATFAIYDTGAPNDQAVDFYQVTAPWRGPDEPGIIHAFMLLNFVEAQ